MLILVGFKLAWARLGCQRIAPFPSLYLPHLIADPSLFGLLVSSVNPTAPDPVPIASNMFRLQSVQSLQSRASFLPLELHNHLASNPPSTTYKDVVVRLGRQITTFCSEVRELISWWKSAVPSAQAHTDIDKLVEQCHAAFDKIDHLVPVGGQGENQHDGDREDDYWQHEFQGWDADAKQNVEYISAYINAVSRTFRVMTDTFRIAEMMYVCEIVTLPVR